MAWSAYHKQWFPAYTSIQFYIIDDIGEEYHISLKSITDSTIKNNKLYITLHHIPLLSTPMEIYPHYKIETSQFKETSKNLRVDNIENVSSTGFK